MGRVSIIGWGSQEIGALHQMTKLGRVQEGLSMVMRHGGGDALPFAVAQRADGARLQPTRDAVEVEHVATAAPGNAVACIVSQPRICARHRGERGEREECE